MTEQEFERRMRNWALWHAADRRTERLTASSSPYPAYNLAPPGRRAGNVMPILHDEAEQVEACVQQLKAEMPRAAYAVIVGWLKVGNLTLYARTCRCHVNTFKRRWEAGNDRLRRLLEDRTRRSTPTHAVATRAQN